MSTPALARKGNSPTEIKLVAQVDIQAAEGKDEGIRFSMIAYTGGDMRVGHTHSVIVDIAGMIYPPAIPILVNHENSTGSFVGNGEVKAATDKIIIEGKLARVPKVLDEIIPLTKAGIPLQASIGASIEALEFIKEGKSVQVNGQTFKGPVYVATKSTLQEASLVPKGADPNTEVRIAAKQQNKDSIMDEKEKEAIVIAERNRIKEIKALKANGPDTERARQLEAKAIDGEIDNTELTSGLLTEMRSSRPSVPGVMIEGTDAPRSSIMASAVLSYMGRSDIAEQQFGAQIAQQGEDLRVHNPLDLLKAVLGLEGINVPSSRSAIIKAAFSTMSLPIALGSAFDKVTQSGFETVPSSWPTIVKKLPLKNFHQIKTIRTYLSSRLEDIAPGGEIKYMSVAESTGSLQLKTVGGIIGITRQDIINDDLGVFDQLGDQLGASAARRISDDFYTLLLSNPSSFFDTANKNYFTGASSALSVSSLSTAIQMLRSQTDENGLPVDMIPATLLVPPELEATARGLISSELLGRSDGQPTGNPHRQVAQLAVEPRLSNASFTGNSAKAWYLFARPESAAALVGFLDGRESPILDFAGVNADPSTLGLTWRIYHDFAVGLGETRAVVKSKGEA